MSSRKGTELGGTKASTLRWKKRGGSVLSKKKKKEYYLSRKERYTLSDPKAVDYLLL